MTAAEESFPVQLLRLDDGKLLDLYWFSDKLPAEDCEAIEAELDRRGLDPQNKP